MEDLGRTLSWGRRTEELLSGRVREFLTITLSLELKTGLVIILDVIVFGNGTKFEVVMTQFKDCRGRWGCIGFMTDDGDNTGVLSPRDLSIACSNPKGEGTEALLVFLSWGGC